MFSLQTLFGIQHKQRLDYKIILLSIKIFDGLFFEKFADTFEHID